MISRQEALTPLKLLPLHKIPSTCPHTSLPVAVVPGPFFPEIQHAFSQGWNWRKNRPPPTGLVVRMPHGRARPLSSLHYRKQTPAESSATISTFLLHPLHSSDRSDPKPPVLYEVLSLGRVKEGFPFHKTVFEGCSGQWQVRWSARSSGRCCNC